VVDGLVFPATAFGGAAALGWQPEFSPDLGAGTGWNAQPASAAS
jgi:hypothetical protein